MIDQVHRQVRVKTALPDSTFTVKSAQISEEISAPFDMHLELYSDEAELAFDDLLGHNLTLSIDCAAGVRHFNGFVTQFGFSGSRGRRFVYRAVVAPWLWFLTQTENCRIFHDSHALDIVKAIFAAHNFTGFRDDTSGAFAAREYCVQYRESDFNFVSRLLEQEGVSYYFEHENGEHTLVLFNQGSALSRVPEYGAIKLFARDDFSQRRREGIFSWRPRRQVRPTRVTVNDFDFAKPGAMVKSAAMPRRHALASMEVYRYPGLYVDPAQGDAIAKTRIEALQSSYEEISADANSRGLRSGALFTLCDHPVRAYNRDYIVAAVHHVIEGDLTETGGGHSEEIYSATLRAVPHDAPLRPLQRARKPVIAGPQTAIVKNDTQGEEIEPDEHGRVKVAFHWERYGESSCWVRVSQAWAGAGWGAMSIPREGQEVVVEFIEGDPDRPIITGRVYNGDSRPPYDPRSNATITTFKTDSSKGGGGFNELRFDDKKGAENIFIHAQKNFDLRTRNTRRDYVGFEAHSEIGKKEFRKVGEEKHETIGHNSFAKVGQDAHREAGMNIFEAAGMNYVLNAGMNAHLKAGLNTVIEAGAGLTIKVGGSFITLNPAGVFISGPMVLVNSGGAALSGEGTKPDAPEEPQQALSAKPGARAKGARARSHEPTRQEIDAHPTAVALAAAAAAGAPFCKICPRGA